MKQQFYNWKVFNDRQKIRLSLILIKSRKPNEFAIIFFRDLLFLTEK